MNRADPIPFKEGGRMEDDHSYLRSPRPDSQEGKSGKWLAWLNLFGFLIMVTVNYLANALPLNHLNTGQLSDKYPNLFVPAGITFSIWGIIYLVLGIFVFYSLYQAWTKRAAFPAYKRLGLLFFLTCLANAGWIFAWHYEQLLLSLLVMLILLVLLIAIYQKLENRSPMEKTQDKFPARVAFSLYLAWIGVATVANAAAVLVGYGWNRFGLSEQFWTVAVLAFITVLTLIFILKKRDIIYSLTIIWALLGILYKRLEDTSSADQIVQVATIAGLAVIILAIILRFGWKRQKAGL